MLPIVISLLMIMLTIVVYGIAREVYFRKHTPFLLPILTSTVVISVILILFHLPYDVYMTGGKWINHLLGPAIVAFAIPLYNQRETLKKYFIPMLCGVTVGSITGILTGIEFAKWMGIKRDVVYSILPKSVTTPVAMEISKEIGGAPSLTAVLVIIAGLIGAVFGPFILKWSNVYHELGKGIGFGSASHAIGTSRAIEDSEMVGAVSSLAMILCAVITSILGPLFVLWLPL